MLNDTDSLKIFVIEQILSEIFSQNLKAGDILLSKRQLALKYCVSRTVVDRAIDYLLAKGYIALNEEGLYEILDFNRYKNLEDLINFSKYKNQAFTEKEIEDVRELKIGLDLLAVKLIDAPLKEEDYARLKAILDDIHLGCDSCEHEKCARCATILYEFYAELARLSHNTFLNLLYSAFQETNILIISKFIKTHAVVKLHHKALDILNALHENRREDAVRLLNEDLR